MLVSCMQPNKEEITGGTSSFGSGDLDLTTISNTVISEGGLVSLNIDEGFDDFDSEGNSVTYSCYYDLVMDGSVLGVLPCSNLTGMSFNSSTGNFNWTPDQQAAANGDAAGNYEFKIVGGSTLGTGEEVFVINVIEVDIVPQFATMSPVSILGTNSMTIDANDNSTFSDQDEDGQALTYSCSFDRDINGIPDTTMDCNTLGFNFLPGSGVISGTPAQYGDYEFRLTMDDGTTGGDITFVGLTVTGGPPGASVDEAWIEVPFNAGGMGLNSFWVMFYEAKAWNDLDGDSRILSAEIDADGCGDVSCITTPTLGVHKPASTFEGAPWRAISANNSFSECRSLGTGYHLMTNEEWMAIARDIESVSANWTSGTVGTGSLFRGNSGADSTSSYNNGGLDFSTGRNTKARMTLSNGAFIWDISGNVAEWVDWNDPTTVYGTFLTGPVSCPLSPSTQNLDSINCTSLAATPELYNSAGDYSFAKGVGIFVPGTGGAAARGGAHTSDAGVGIFTLSLFSTSTASSSATGFRCVYRP